MSRKRIAVILSALAALLMVNLVRQVCAANEIVVKTETKRKGDHVMTDPQKRTYYSDEKMRILSENLERYDWAREERRQILERADKWLRYDDAKLRTLVPPPEVPRAYETHVKGAPINGEALYRLGRYSWIISFDEPWKVKNPADGRVYPSNDFEAFMKSGFKDRSLLTGPYPDDGWGWKPEGEEDRYWFVAYYASHSIGQMLLPALDDLSRAYLMTNDPRYAHACALLLWQIADRYPDYIYEKQSRNASRFDRVIQGRLDDYIMENYICCTAALAYDAIKPAIENDKALSVLTNRSGSEIHGDIEERLLRTMVNDIMGGERIKGNYGMHQLALALLAIVLQGSDRTPTSDAMIEWILHNPNPLDEAGVGLVDAINNYCTRDGCPSESPDYNMVWVRMIGRLVDALGERGRSIVEMPRFKEFFTWPLRITVAGEFTPAHGDTSGMFHPRLGWNSVCLGPAYRFYKDPAFASAIMQEDEKPQRDLFQRPLDDELREAAARCPGPLGVQSELLPGVGFVSLQTGGPANRTGLAFFYGAYNHHLHFDQLHFDLYSWRNALMPDLGYPEQTDPFDPRRFSFVANTVAHNTVVINARRQTRGYPQRQKARGRLHLFDTGTFAQLAEFSAEDCYPDLAKLYRRTLILVAVSPEQAYVVDIVRVRGGEQHDWVVHGGQADFQSDIPFSAPRAEGTLAGRDVPYGVCYDDERYGEGKPFVSNWLYEGSGFQWFFNVQEAALKGVGAVSWHLNRPAGLDPDRPGNGAVLRAHILGSDETLFACDAKPQPHKTWPETVKFLFRRRVGHDLESVFVTVFEPYRETPFLDSVRPLPVRKGADLAVALEIRCGDKRHIIFNRLEGAPEERAVLELPDGARLDARTAVLERTGDGTPTRTYILDDAGSRVPELRGQPPRESRAVVSSVDYGKGEVTLSAPLLSAQPVAGGVAMVEGPRRADVVPVARIVADRTFAVGDDDLAAGTFHVTGVEGRRIRFKPEYLDWVEPGMTVVNEAGKAVGRLESIQGGQAVLEGPSLSLEDFPDLNGDGRRTCRVVVVGPGDSVTLHASRRSESGR